MDGLTGLSHFGYPSSDLDATIAFYTEVSNATVQWQTERQTKICITGGFQLAIRRR